MWRTVFLGAELRYYERRSSHITDLHVSSSLDHRYACIAFGSSVAGNSSSKHSEPQKRACSQDGNHDRVIERPLRERKATSMVAWQNGLRRQRSSSKPVPHG